MSSSTPDGTGDASAGSGAGPKSYTAPKGRPTRSRDHPPVRRRLFGPIAQWTAAALLIVAIVALIIMWTDGGDFNPFDQEGGAPETGAPTAQSSSMNVVRSSITG